jgi:nucleoside-diphosphate-sugar epimerase
MENKTALVTGADGFIGSHLTEMLVAKGYKLKHFRTITHSIIGDG